MHDGDERNAAFRQWAEERDERFRQWSEEREAGFREWSEGREREFRQWSVDRDRKMSDFLDALTDRHVGITQHLIAGFDRLASEVSSALAQLQAEIADQREQIQANTEALLKVLDRLEPGTG